MIEDAHRTFVFLQYLCEGHKEKMQNYLRDQFEKDDLRYSQNVDFINLTAQAFGSIIKILRPELTELACQMIDFMIESVQGPCKQNQLVLFDSKIVDYCKDLMSEFDRKHSYAIKGFKTAEEQQQIDETVKKSVKMLTSILEGSKNKEMVSYMYNNLDLEYLHDLLAEEFLSYFRRLGLDKKDLEKMTVDDVNSRVQDSHFEGQIVDAFEVFDLISRLREEHSEKLNQSKTRLRGLNLIAYEFFKSNSGLIQIVFKDDEIYNIRSIIHPACRTLDSSAKNAILLGLDRSTAKDKISDFMNKAPKLFELIDHSTYLKKLRLLCFKNLFNSKVLSVINVLAFLVVVCVNFIVFYFFKKKVYRGTSINNPRVDANHISIKVLNIAHIVLVSLQIIVWIIVKMPVVLKDGWRDIFLDYRQKLVVKNLDFSEMDLAFRDRSLASVSYSERIGLLQQIHAILGSRSSTPRLEYFVHTCKILCGNMAFLYSLMNVTLSICALVYKQPFFFGLELLEIIVGQAD